MVSLSVDQKSGRSVHIFDSYVLVTKHENEEKIIEVCEICHHVELISNELILLLFSKPVNTVTLNEWIESLKIPP